MVLQAHFVLVQQRHQFGGRGRRGRHQRRQLRRRLAQLRGGLQHAVALLGPGRLAARGVLRLHGFFGLAVALQQRGQARVAAGQHLLGCGGAVAVGQQVHQRARLGAFHHHQRLGGLVLRQQQRDERPVHGLLVGHEADLGGFGVDAGAQLLDQVQRVAQQALSRGAVALVFGDARAAVHHQPGDAAVLAQHREGQQFVVAGLGLGRATLALAAARQHEEPRQLLPDPVGRVAVEPGVHAATKVEAAVLVQRRASLVVLADGQVAACQAQGAGVGQVGRRAQAGLDGLDLAQQLLRLCTVLLACGSQRLQGERFHQQVAFASVALAFKPGPGAGGLLCGGRCVAQVQQCGGAHERHGGGGVVQAEQDAGAVAPTQSGFQPVQAGQQRAVAPGLRVGVAQRVQFAGRQTGGGRGQAVGQFVVAALAGQVDDGAAADSAAFLRACAAGRGQQQRRQHHAPHGQNQLPTCAMTPLVLDETMSDSPPCM